jgi:phage regulator Rha-like protein
MTDNPQLVPDDIIMSRIYCIREQKVMLDRDLAELYGVETKQLKRQVNRNVERFPEDFMFQLRPQEQEILRYQFGTLKWGEHSKYLSYAFTEQGVAMLSSVLNSKRAIQVNIQIIRVFTSLRKMLLDNTELRLAIEELRKQTRNNTQNIELVFKYLDELLDKREKTLPPTKIGFKTNNK